ncbi:MAG: GYD domain-containing protein [Pyrinomonadaceae bacterium]
MAYFLLQGAYTAEAWGTLVNNPTDRVEAIRPVVERLGGSVENAFFSFGDYDVVLILRMPDNVSAAAFSLAVAAGGAFKSHKTIPLMSIEEGVAAMRKAGDTGYNPPGK